MTRSHVSRNVVKSNREIENSKKDRQRINGVIVQAKSPVIRDASQ